MTKLFNIGDILSITHKHLVSRRHMEGVYDILNFMTGESLFTHQLPRAAEVCRPALLKQLPALDTSEVRMEVAKLVAMLDTEAGKAFREKLVVGWLCRMEQKYGELHPVEPLSQGQYVPKDPIAEAVEKFGAARVIVAEV